MRDVQKIDILLMILLGDNFIIDDFIFLSWAKFLFELSCVFLSRLILSGVELPDLRSMYSIVGLEVEYSIPVH